MYALMDPYRMPQKTQLNMWKTDDIVQFLIAQLSITDPIKANPNPNPNPSPDPNPDPNPEPSYPNTTPLTLTLTLTLSPQAPGQELMKKEKEKIIILDPWRGAKAGGMSSLQRHAGLSSFQPLPPYPLTLTLTLTPTLTLTLFFLQCRHTMDAL
jgi:hypothetical protein